MHLSLSYVGDVCIIKNQGPYYSFLGKNQALIVIDALKLLSLKHLLH